MRSDPEDPIRFDLIDPGQWRVVDVRQQPSSGRHIVGFVELIAGIFHVTILKCPRGEPAFCPTLTAARSYFDE
jgi:hypothetical protein